MQTHAVYVLLCIMHRYTVSVHTLTQCAFVQVRNLPQHTIAIYGQHGSTHLASSCSQHVEC